MLARGTKCMSNELLAIEEEAYKGNLQDRNTQREVCQPGEEHEGEGSRQERG